MKLEDFGQLTEGICTDCRTEVLEKALAAGHDWLGRDRDGEIVVTNNTEATRWLEEHREEYEKTVFVAEVQRKEESEYLIELCPRHLNELADLVAKTVEEQCHAIS